MIGANQSKDQVPLEYLRFKIRCVFAEYDLFKPTISIKKIVYL